MGGTESSSTTVEWVMAELLKNPEAMNKLKEELTQVVGLNKMVEESHLSQLHYLNAVIKETLRLHPPFPLLVPRTPNQNTTLGGYKVPKGASIYINAWAIQRDPTLWENPLEFRPERFLMMNGTTQDHDVNAGKLAYTGNNFNFIAFGSGRRICAGLPLAERVLTFVLASFLHSFDWKLPEFCGKLDLSDTFGIVTKKLDPLIAVATPRLSDLKLYE